MWVVVLCLLLLLLVVVAAVLFLYFLRPTVLAQVFMGLWRRRCGMQVKFIGDKDYVFCYGERGQKSSERSSILFVHGFTASKDQWNMAFKNLPKEYHLVAMDMPGHGATTTPPESQDLCLEFGLGVIKQFAELVGLTDKPFHIVGASLGGCMVGLFAAHFPHLVERVTMICPAMRCPEESEFSLQVQKAVEMGRDEIELEHCSLLPQTPHDLQLMMDSCVYTKVNINKQILKGFMDLRSPKNSYFLRVYRSLATEENLTVLENTCHRITAPSQLIWGDHDQIIHPSGAQVLAKKLPDCRDVTILDRCGHSVDLDRPYACCSSIVRFRADMPPKQKSA
ncbi:monoacylglycerol lipase ABHD6-like isoform X2 [Babylonia areolata]